MKLYFNSFGPPPRKTVEIREIFAWLDKYRASAIRHTLQTLYRHFRRQAPRVRLSARRDTRGCRRGLYNLKNAPRAHGQRRRFLVRAPRA